MSYLILNSMENSKIGLTLFSTIFEKFIGRKIKALEY